MFRVQLKLKLQLHSQISASLMPYLLLLQFSKFIVFLPLRLLIPFDSLQCFSYFIVI